MMVGKKLKAEGATGIQAEQPFYGQAARLFWLKYNSFVAQLSTLTWRMVSRVTGRIISTPTCVVVRIE